MARRKKSAVATVGRYARKTVSGVASFVADFLEITPEKKPAGRKKPVARKGAVYPVALYGTCRKGGENHWRIRGSTFVRYVTIVGHIRVKRAGGPAIVPGPGRVQAELWEVDGETLRALDQYEGMDFPRRSVRLEDGSTAWAYVFQGHV